ncbi:hypothetical protein GCM10010435_00290 [Winogradskya consettensis]|uniref:Uncharacterized protein n=1 Tax=Winogradskya consettensis TaxID=113560 RepID=A0A919T5A6_9ACTN|nr:hypothetical protein Aco04nite_96430 [Actinoplanes consettensis]
MVARHQHPQGIHPEDLGGDPRGTALEPPDPDVEAAVGEQPALLRHACLHLVNLHLGVARLHGPQDRPDRVVPLVEDAESQRGCGDREALCEDRRPFDVVKNLTGFDEKSGAGTGQGDVPGRTINELNADGPLEPLDLGGQRGGDDVLAGCGPAEVQLLGEGDEIAELA